MSDINERMQKAVDSLEKELSTIRTGRANPNILDRIQAEYYGSLTPLNAMANIIIVDGRTLEIKPFDKSALKDIEKAISDSDLGLTPTNDGNRLLISIPELTADRRKELVKLVKKEAENSKVSIRNVRRDEMDKVKKDDSLTEDDKKSAQDDIQKSTDDYVKKIDEVAAKKEKELLTI